MPLILIDAAGVVIGASAGADDAPVRAGLPVALAALQPGVDLAGVLRSLWADGQPDAQALLMGLQAVLAGHQQRFEHRRQGAGWRVRMQALAVPPPGAVAASVELEAVDPALDRVAQLQAALSVAERRLTAVQAVAGLGSWFYDVATRRSQFSPETYRLLALDPATGALDSAAIRERVHPDDLGALRAARDRVYAGEPLVSVRLRFRGGDGVERWLEVRLTFEPAADGQPQVVVGTVRDIGDSMRAQSDLERHRDRLEELVVSRTVQLAEASERAEAASRAKSAFLAHTSHEIRTPLNVIVSLAHLVQRADPASPQRGRLQAIEQAGRHLSSMIDDVLDIARAEGLHLSLRSVPVQLAVVLDEAAAMVRPQAEARGLPLQVQALPQAAQVPLLGDPARLRQALLNALRHAVATASGGAVQLGLHIGDARDGRVPVRATVGSLGSSDPAQFDGDTNLAALRRLVRLMNGRVTLDAGPQGSRSCSFSVDLEPQDMSLAPVAAPAPVIDPVVQLRQRHAGRRVLLAEDDDVSQMAMVELLGDAGLVVDTADDGLAAVDKASRRPYALIVLDLRMPRLDGISAARTIRALPGLQATPLVAITANAFEEDRIACRLAGMNDFLPKPVEVRRLYDMLLHWLDQAGSPPAPRLEGTPAPMHPAAPAASPLPPAPAPAAGAVPGVDLMAPLLGLEGVDAVGGLASVGGKAIVYRRLLAVFGTTHHADGQQVCRLIEAGDTHAAGALAHRMRGSAATLGLIDVETAAAALELAIESADSQAPLADLAKAVDESLAATLQRLREALAV